MKCWEEFQEFLTQEALHPATSHSGRGAERTEAPDPDPEKLQSECTLGSLFSPETHAGLPGALLCLQVCTVFTPPSASVPCRRATSSQDRER